MRSGGEASHPARTSACRTCACDTDALKRVGAWCRGKGEGITVERRSTGGGGGELERSSSRFGVGRGSHGNYRPISSLSLSHRTLAFSSFRSSFLPVLDDPRAPSITNLLCCPCVTCSPTHSFTRFRWLHLLSRYIGSCALRDFGTSTIQPFTIRNFSCFPRHHYPNPPAHLPRRKRP